MMRDKKMAQIGAMGRMVGKVAGGAMKAGKTVGEKMQKAKSVMAPRLKEIVDAKNIEPMSGRF